MTETDQGAANEGRRCSLFKPIVAGLLVVAALLLVACGGGGDSSSSSSAKPTGAATSASGGPDINAKVVNGYNVCATGGSSDLTGAGSTFVFPLMSRWVDDYQKLCSVKVNYQSVGSGAGITQLTQKTVDFGASDAIMTDAQEKAASDAGGPVLHIAVTSGPVALIYNLPGVSSGQLKLSSEVVADIFLKKIKKWNDPAIAALNTGVSLPNADIAVVHRSDGSGTTYILTNYLAAVSPDWKSQIGSGTSVNWPGDIGGQGSEGVAGSVRQTPGSIGYVDVAYAIQNNLAFAQVKNKAGNFVSATIEGATAAATGVTIPPDMKIVIVDQANPQAYPISGFVWVLAYQNQNDAAKCKSTASFLWWAIHNGQGESKALTYASLSTDTVKVAEAQVQKISAAGAPCLTR
jgi:phosphate transport system substrate-binding protein